MYVYMCIHICVCVYIYVYIYIYVERERDFGSHDCGRREGKFNRDEKGKYFSQNGKENILEDTCDGIAVIK